METFKCDSCKDIFKKNITTEEEKIKELHKNFGHNFSPKECGIVCDDCYNKILEFYKIRK